MVTPQFLNIGSEGMPLQAIVPTGSDTSDNVSLQTLDSSGRTVDMYYWNDWASDEPCWVDDNFEKVEGVFFAPGAGLWIQGSSSEQGIQSAGQVGESDTLIQLRFGATATGNPTPVTIDLQDIIPEGDETSDNVSLQTLNSSGKTVQMYFWNDWACDEPCWVDDNFEKVEGVTFGPGAGLLVSGSSDSQYLRFPAPEL